MRFDLDIDSLRALLVELGASLCAWRDDHRARAISEPTAFKTEADRRAHEFLVTGLSRITPGVRILSEEDAPSAEATVRSAAPYWIIDPLDGTASWYGGFAGFVTQAALMWEHVPVAGIIHAPVSARTWFAQRGQGATLNEQPLRRPRPSAGLVFTDNTPTPHGITRRIMEATRSVDYVESGSIGLKSALVADGTADVFVKDVVVRDWDLAPAAAVLAEVGAELRRLDGSPYRFDGEMEKRGGFIVAANAATMAAVLHAHDPASLQS